MAIDSEDQIQKGYYEQKGYIRQMIILPEAQKNKLKQIAKTYAITQGEVIEVMLDQVDLTRKYDHFSAKRSEKLAGRSSIRAALTRKMKDLTPEQLTAIEAIINQPEG
jgi:hypothetical protein